MSTRMLLKRRLNECRNLRQKLVASLIKLFFYNYICNQMHNNSKNCREEVEMKSGIFSIDYHEHPQQ